MQIICKNCGRSYSDGIEISNSVNVTLTNNQARCPYCKSWNKGLSGTFDFDAKGNVIKKYFERANLTVEEVLKFRSLLQSATLSEVSTIEDLSVRAESINYGLSDLFRHLKSLNVDVKWVITTLLAVIALYLQYKGTKIAQER